MTYPRRFSVVNIIINTSMSASKRPGASGGHLTLPAPYSLLPSPHLLPFFISITRALIFLKIIIVV